MIANLHSIPITERIKLVEDLWDSIAEDRATIKMTVEQKDELDRRLDAYEFDGIKGHLASEAIANIKKRL